MQRHDKICTCGSSAQVMRVRLTQQNVLNTVELETINDLFLCMTPYMVLQIHEL